MAIHRNVRFVFFVFFVLFTAIPGFGADNLYFTGLCVGNEATGSKMVLLSWDALEGAVPADIDSFRLYRKDTGAYVKLVEIPKALTSASTLRGYFMEPGEAAQLNDMLQWMASAYPEANGDNFHEVLHDVLDPDGPGCSQVPPAESCLYDPMQRQFLSRYSRDVARALGRAYLDTTVAADTSYTYMLTAMRGENETSPLGIVNISTTAETILPAPGDFRQVLVSRCSAMRRQIDHGRVHFNWTVPSAPSEMGSRILVHGYDLFRASGDLGTLDLRYRIPQDLVRVNDIPIIVSGPPPQNPMHNYLAIDEGAFLDGGDALEPGTVYYYYLAARDLAGEYSGTAGPLEVMVPDLEAPVAPWNVSTQREMVDIGGGTEPRLTVIWDQVNNINYLKEYCDERTVCGGNAQRVCYVEKGSSCEDDSPSCVDLEVVQYLVYRFDSFEDALVWGGTDSDNDLWPDELEDLNLDGVKDPGEWNPCDPAEHPPGVPPDDLPLPVVAVIAQNDATHIRTLETGKTLLFYQDSGPQPDNRVYWYRVAAKDSYGNRSELSPPTRAALWDRSQPDVVDATLDVYQCEVKAFFHGDAEEPCSRNSPDPSARLSIFDETGLAKRVALYEICSNPEHERMVVSRPLTDGRCELYYNGADPASDLYRHCEQAGEFCGSYLVRFFGADNAVIADSETFSAMPCTSRAGCVVLYRDCDYVSVGAGDAEFGAVHWPLYPLRVCVNLSENQCARLYQEIGGDMAPVGSFCHPGGAGNMTICDTVSVETIVSAYACLGIQVFSPNHVGSGMVYLPCVTVAATSAEGKPPAPEIEKVIKKGSTDGASSQYPPKFEVTWGSAGEGIAAFVVSRRGSSGTFYETVWDPQINDVTLLFSKQMPITPAEVNKKWCFRVRAVDRALQMSDWSSEQCQTWDQSLSTETLAWPAMTDMTRGNRVTDLPTPPEGVDVTAFVINGEKVPAIVLSSDLSLGLQRLLVPGPLGYLVGESACEHGYGVCQGSNPCVPSSTPSWWSGDLPWTSSWYECDMCDRLWDANKVGDFVVYRQEEGEEFVQVSPLVDRSHCTTGSNWSAMEDAVIAMAKLQSGSVVGGSDLVPQGDLVSNLEGTVRLLFLDYYPVKEGTKVRYQMVHVDPQTKEPTETYMSNWIEIPPAW